VSEEKPSGARAESGGVAAGERGYAAGRDIVQNQTTYVIHSYLADKGPRAVQGMGEPSQFWDTTLEGTIGVEALRDTLLTAPPDYIAELKHKPARLVSVSGLLYPCGLMVSGWWESHFEKIQGMQWKNGIQAWLFQGFHSWGPSFDFSWDFEGAGALASRPAFIAQLGAGDEANSIPVIIPAEKARKLCDVFRERGHEIGAQVAPLVATVDGVLCHRSQCPAAAALGSVGGILDYCIWIKDGEPQHRIRVGGERADMYSGYLWKVLAPRALVENAAPLRLNDAYFAWEHTNFADEDSVKYNLDSLEHKAAYLARVEGAELVVLAKSSVLVRGETYWSKQQFYDYFWNKQDI
jgi:hypothetical protein